MFNMQIPCAGTPVYNTYNNYRKFKAITKTSSIWKQGQKGFISITFGTTICNGCGEGAAWSFIGNESSGINPSMNLGFIDPPYGSFEYKGIKYDVPFNSIRNYCTGSGNLTAECRNNPSPGNCNCAKNWVAGATVVHEFGHALGMMHEHQNNLKNSNPIKLNKSNVVNYYITNNMTEQDAEVNVLKYYDDNTGYEGTDFDSDSIMLYALRNDWVEGNNPTKPNFTLSKKDIEWLQKMYPLDSKDPPVITVTFVDSVIEQWKKAWVEKVVLEAYGPIIGVKWNFISDLQESKDYKDSKEPKEPKEINEVPKRNCLKNNNLKAYGLYRNYSNNNRNLEETDDCVENKSELGIEHILGITFGTMIGLVLIILSIVFTVKFIKNRRFKNINQ